MAGVKDKLNGEEWAPAADKAHGVEAVPDAPDDATELRPEEATTQEAPQEEELAAPTEEQVTGPTEPRAAATAESPEAPHEWAPQVEHVAHRDLELPAPGLPDEPVFTGEPFISAAEAPDGEPMVADALAWQPEIEPDPDQQSDLIASDDVAVVEPMQVEAATEPFEPAPEDEPERDTVLFAREAHEQPEPETPLAPPDEPLPVPTSDEEAATEATLQDKPLAEQIRSDPISMEAEPFSLEAEPAEQAVALPRVESPADIAEHTPVDLPSIEEPAAQTSIEHAAELPLRDRIPSVRPVQPEAIKTPLAVPVFEETARPPEARQPEISNASHDAEAALVASLRGRIAIPHSTDDAAPTRAPVPDITPLIYRVLRLAAAAAVGLGCLVLVLIALYRWVNPPASTLMLGQWLTGTRIDQRWVPLDRISPYLQRAVITSEDGRFCRHHGVDWDEIEEALERARDGVPRGGSTISMQVVKNLFLWPSKSYVRKALEIPLTYAIEFAWSKRRILEIYLNIAEWGPGVFGAEAAARYHFGKPAAALTPSQAALLAVALPNPRERRAGAPGPGTLRLATNLHARMMAAAGSTACVQARR
jgi:monofunctional biosynthetic peptidoglycan transglycosylase